MVKGWREATNYTALEMIQQLEPFCSGFLCTYVDKEGMMQGTDLDWFISLRGSTAHELIAAGGITTMDDVQALNEKKIHCAIGMSIYTGRLDLAELRQINETKRGAQQMKTLSWKWIALAALAAVTVLASDSDVKNVITGTAAFVSLQR